MKLLKGVGVAAMLAGAAMVVGVPMDAHAAAAFGTEAESFEMVDAMIAVIDADGLDAGIAAMHDPALPFAASALGVHVFQSGIIVADNREP